MVGKGAFKAKARNERKLQDWERKDVCIGWERCKNERKRRKRETNVRVDEVYVQGES